MKINILEFVEGARKAEGLTVIIDVFRAFSVACYSYDEGASMVIATDSAEKAMILGNTYKKHLLVGERDERKIEGFDCGNSPTEILTSDVKGRVVIHTTTAGTNGLMNAMNADSVITGSLVNAGAIIRYIKEMNPNIVSLVAMGFRAQTSALEDLLCAEIIKDGLLGDINDYSKEIDDLRFSSGKRFFIPENRTFSPPSDFFLCTKLSTFDFVLKGERRDDGNVGLVKIDV